MRRSPLRSPPRMRGKVGHSAPSPPTYRITPAYAGKSRCNLPSTAPWKDHPRVCGEKPLQSSVNCTMEGSPPRVRGKVAMEHFSIAICGITPAYAGKSSCSRPGSLSSRDHPRVCGEKRKTGAVPAPLPGSPPRMRGKARSHAQLYYDAGKSCTSFQLMFFIWDHPAYAGKRPVLFSDSWIHRDHPRVCGEKFKPFCLRQLCQGSPPRVRGKV